MPRFEYISAKAPDRDPFSIILLGQFLVVTDQNFVARLRRNGLDASESDYDAFRNAYALKEMRR